MQWSASTTDLKHLETAVNVKEILPTQLEAEREVERLNAVADSGSSVYFWQATRFYAEGRSAAD